MPDIIDVYNAQKGIEPIWEAPPPGRRRLVGKNSRPVRKNRPPPKKKTLISVSKAPTSTRVAIRPVVKPTTITTLKQRKSQRLSGKRVNVYSIMPQHVVELFRK